MITSVRDAFFPPTKVCLNRRSVIRFTQQYVCQDVPTFLSLFASVSLSSVCIMLMCVSSLQAVCEEIRRLAPQAGLHHDGVVFGSDDFCASIGTCSTFSLFSAQTDSFPSIHVWISQVFYLHIINETEVKTLAFLLSLSAHIRGSHQVFSPAMT